jgi:hypothetical protein
MSARTDSAGTVPMSTLARATIGMTVLLLGAAAAACGMATLFSFFMFDAPGSESSVTTLNFALAHPVFVMAYLFSLPLAMRAMFGGERAQARRWIVVQAAAAVWLAQAYGIFIFGCHGRFVCNVLN